MQPEPKPHPKSAQLARGARRYRRYVASPKQWQAIVAAKLGPCRICGSEESNGRLHGHIEFHHVVARQRLGDDVADNLVPVCRSCHEDLTLNIQSAVRELLATLTDAEYAYMVERGGEHYAERAYGLTYSRAGKPDA